MDFFELTNDPNNPNNRNTKYYCDQMTMTPDALMSKFKDKSRMDAINPTEELIFYLTSKMVFKLHWIFTFIIS